MLKCQRCDKLLKKKSPFCRICALGIAKKVDLLCPTFNEISDGEDDNLRKKYQALMPKTVIELYIKCATDKFEYLKGIDYSIQQLSEQALEEIEVLYQLVARDGFWMYLAKLRSVGWLKPEFNDVDLNEVIQKWDDLTTSFRKANGRSIVEDEVLFVFMNRSDSYYDSLLKRLPEVQKLSVLAKKKIKLDFISMPCWVYGASMLCEKQFNLSHLA